MSSSDNPEFDRYAKNYTDLHRASVRASGEEPSYFSRYKAQYMARQLGRSEAGRPQKVLDFGCGVGNSIPHLREAFPQAELHGIDPSPESVKQAQASHAGNAEFRVSAAAAIPYRDHSFDLVHVACVFHHIEPQRRDHWMREIRRVLKPGGQAFVFEHNVLNLLTLKAVRDCPFDEDAVLLPRRELLDLAHITGFTSVSARYIVFFPAALTFMRRMEPGLGLIPFGAQYVVRATA